MTLTQRYALPQWGREDWIGRWELNRAMGQVDAIPRVVVGTYTGDDQTTRTIDLGFRPKAVLVVDPYGAMRSSQATYGGLAMDGYPTYCGTTLILAVVENGFQVGRGEFTGSSYYADTNNSGKTYRYLAIQA